MKKLIFFILLLISLQSVAQVTGFSGIGFMARDSSLAYQTQAYSSSVPNQGLPTWGKLSPFYKQYMASKASNYVVSWNPSNNQYGYTGKVDSIWREAGKDSIMFTIAGVRYAIKDSTGGGGSGITVGTTTITSGTDTRVPFNDGGVYGEDAGMVFDKTTNNLTVGSATVSALTATRVTLAGTAGLLADDADLTFSGTTLDVGSGNTGLINIGNSNINSPDANGMYIFAGGGSLFLGTNTSTYGMAIKSGSVYIGGSSTPTARLHLPAGATGAGTAPLKFTSGTLNTTAEAGAVEFLTDKLYATITTGAARKEITLNDAALTSGTTPVATTNGRLTDGLILASGTYTPTLTNVTNVTASTAYACQYMRVGNTVTVSGKIDIDITVSGAFEIGMSLPVASNFSADEQCAGTAVGTNHTPTDADAMWIKADGTNDRVALMGNDSGTTDHTHYFTFTYRII